MFDFKVKLLSVTGDPQLIAAVGALGCFEEDASSEILERLLSLSAEERDKKIKAVIKNSFGMGHGSVGDQCCFIFGIENLPRIATLQLCLPEFAAHLQQSLRRAKPERGFHLPRGIKNSSIRHRVETVLNESFNFYVEATKAGIPGEDARYLLPLFTRTNIQTAINARELSHLWIMSNKKSVPSVVSDVVGEMMKLAIENSPHLFEDFGGNYEQLAWYPSSQLFAEKNETIEQAVKSYGNENVILVDSMINSNIINRSTVVKAIKTRDEAELANLKHVHFEFLAPMSLACFHQATRQRTWNQSTESIYAALEMGNRIFIPESIRNTAFQMWYHEIHDMMVKMYWELIKKGFSPPEAIGVIPHSQVIYDLIHVNGWNAIHAIGKRTCTKAQLEVRQIAKAMAKIIEEVAPAFDGFVGPQCITYGRCPEKDSCGRLKKK